jgi:hypothetical protein
MATYNTADEPVISSTAAEGRSGSSRVVAISESQDSSLRVRVLPAANCRLVLQVNASDPEG